MAANKDDADIDDVFANEEELEKALCVLAGSDPENCSYSRVRKGFSSASLQPYCRLLQIQVTVPADLDQILCVHFDWVCLKQTVSFLIILMKGFVDLLSHEE